MIKLVLKFNNKHILKDIKMKLYLALNKYLSSDSLLTGNSRRSWEFISAIQKLRKSQNWHFPPAYACTHAHTYAYAQPRVPTFHDRRTWHKMCVWKLYKLAVSRQMYCYKNVPRSIFKDFISFSQVRENIVHLIFVIRGVTCYTECVSSCDYKHSNLLQGLMFLPIWH